MSFVKRDDMMGRDDAVNRDEPRRGTHMALNWELRQQGCHSRSKTRLTR